MKTALCLYGHFRSFDNCWPGLQEYLIKPNHITDIFTMAWVDSEGHFKHPESSSSPITHPGYDTCSQPVNTQWLMQTMQKLEPTAVHFDTYTLHDARFSKMVMDLEEFHHHSEHHRPKGTLSQVWSRCASLKLAAAYEDRTGTAFDQIICTRWDIAYSKPIYIEELDPTVLNMDGMYGPNVISDAWAVGPSSQMRLWSQQFDSIGQLAGNKTMNLGPHEWLQAHFSMYQIPWKNKPDIGIWIQR